MTERVDDLTDLEVAAKAACVTSAPWFTEDDLIRDDYGADARFIALANPARIGELIEASRRLQDVEACARTLLVWLFTTGSVQNHGHREHPGQCGECEQVNGLLAALEKTEKR